jgi:hypothetical protein
VAANDTDDVRTHAGQVPGHGLALGKCARAGGDAQEDLAGAATLSNAQLAQKSLARARMVAGELVALDERLGCFHDVEPERRLQMALVEPKDVVPSAARMKAQDPVGVEGKFHLVAVPERFGRGENRPHRQIAEAA